MKFMQKSIVKNEPLQKVSPPTIVKKKKKKEPLQKVSPRRLAVATYVTRVASYGARKAMQSCKPHLSSS